MIVGTVASSIVGFRKGLIEILVSQGHTVYALAADYSENVMNEVRALGAIPMPYDMSRTGTNPFSDLVATFKLVRLLKKLKPDLMFSYFAKPVIFGTIAGWFAGVSRKVVMIEGLGFLFTKQPDGMTTKTKILQKVQVLLYKFSLPLADSVILLNVDDFEELIVANNINVKSSYVLGAIGLDLDKYRYSPVLLDSISFLFIGRLLKEKGIKEFVDAAKLVKKRFPTVTFTVLGGLDEANPGGMRQSELKQLIDSGVIIYPGHVEDVESFIAQHSVFVLPSYREGYPRSTQEAMAIGRAIITTDVPGCRETVFDGFNGFIVPPWDVEKLADRMVFFIENPDKISVMGDNSYQIAKEKFDARSVNLKLVDILFSKKDETLIISKE